MNPEIICHIMCSVDGKILTDRWTAPCGGVGKGKLMGIYASIGGSLGTDAWMFGKTTLTEGYFPRKYHARDLTPLARPVPCVASPRPGRLFVTADTEADILYDSSTVRGDRMAVILPETAPAEYLDRLRSKGISYLFAGPDGRDLRSAMRTLHTAFGIRSLTLQGGGIIDAAFLRAGLIDTLSIVVYPGIDGSATSTTSFHYQGADNPSHGQSLELLSVQQMDDGVVWLRYKVHHPQSV